MICERKGSPAPDIRCLLLPAAPVPPTGASFFRVIVGGCHRCARRAHLLRPSDLPSLFDVARPWLL